MHIEGFVFVGVGGHVAALDRATGIEIWRTKVKGGDFVNVTVDGENLYATTQGEIFCLDRSSGEVRWHNKLKGLGLGLVTVAGGSPVPAMAEKRRRDAAAANSTAGSAPGAQ